MYIFYVKFKVNANSIIKGEQVFLNLDPTFCCFHV